MQNSSPTPKVNVRPGACLGWHGEAKVSSNYGRRGTSTSAGVAVLGLLLAACGGRTSDDTAGDMTGVGVGGATNAGQGGTTNMGTGGQANTSTGGAFSLGDRCNGLFPRGNCGEEEIQIEGVTNGTDTSGGVSCVLPLKYFVADPYKLVVAIDCSIQTCAPNNAADPGATSGFVVGYEQNPAHLLLLGTSCDLLLVDGTHLVDVAYPCQTFR